MAESFSIHNKTAKILVVDDMALSRVTGRKLLIELGFKSIDLAENGEVAWGMIEKAIAENQPYTLLLSDWMMPVLDGIGLLKRVKKLPPGETLPMIFSTAESDAAQVTEAVKEGIAAYVRKPLTKESLLQALERVSAQVCGNEKQSG